MVDVGALLLELSEPSPGRAMLRRARPGWREPGAICVSHQNLCQFLDLALSCLDLAHSKMGI